MIIKRSFKRDCSSSNVKEKFEERCYNVKESQKNSDEMMVWWKRAECIFDAIAEVEAAERTLLQGSSDVNDRLRVEQRERGRGRKRRKGTKTTSMTTADEGCNHEI